MQGMLCGWRPSTHRRQETRSIRNNNVATNTSSMPQPITVAVQCSCIHQKIAHAKLKKKKKRRKEENRTRKKRETCEEKKKEKHKLQKQRKVVQHTFLCKKCCFYIYTESTCRPLHKIHLLSYIVYSGEDRSDSKKTRRGI